MAASATATATIAEPGVAPEVALPIHRLDLETYNRIVASGALDGQRVELLDGVLVEMSPKSPDHIALVSLLMRHFAVVEGLWLQVQDPIEVLPDSEPEPDLTIAPHKPPPGQLLRTATLVIEVAVSTQAIDRRVKGPLYARAGVPTYWLIDVPARAVEVYSEPTDTGYGRCERHGTEARLSCEMEGVPDVDLATLFAGLDG